MIPNHIQPNKIKIDTSLSLIKYYPYFKRTILWYSDPVLCKQVDNIDFIYDLDRLKRMYNYLSKNGECYYIKIFENGRSHLVGDISLCNGEIGMVVCKEYQNRHIGRRAVRAILERAKEIGLDEVGAEIYAFNSQSKRMFLSVGFEQISEEKYIYKIK